MGDHRWGFDEADDWDDEHVRPARSPAAGEQPEALAGRDPDGVVTVVVGADAEVRSVTLAADWRASVDPRALHRAVLAAADDATMLALARQVEQAPRDVPAPRPVVAAVAAAEAVTPITRADALRLMDAVSADLDRFTRQLAAVADRPVSAESTGRHVSGSALRGRVVELTIDSVWAGSARASEIEAELTDVLRRLHHRGSPPELASGPRSPAIAELTALLSDPQTLLRRVGLLPAPIPGGHHHG